LTNRNKILVLETPTNEEALEAVRSALSRRMTMIIAGNCWVDYQGRARSTLNPGERILIIKEDGSVLVHRPRGYEPVNWQPPGCIFYSSLRKNAILIKAIRQRPRESLQIFINKIHFLAMMSLVDEGEFSLYASEEDMQEAIMIQPSLVEEGLKPITYEKKVKPGFIDVYGIDKEGRMVVIEIKRRTAGKESALQLSRYVDSLKEEINREVRGILVAPGIAKGVQKLLTTLGLEFKRLDPKKCAEILKKKKTKSLEDFY